MTPETPSWVPVSAPVAALTNASAVTAFPARWVKFPPSHTMPLTYSTSFTMQPPPPVQTWALNGLSEPSLTLIAATPRRWTPAAPGAGANLLKLPDT